MLGRPGARPRPGRARLSRSADFDRVFRRGRSHAGRELVLYVFPRQGEGPPRLGLSVSRKVGGAVQRNRIRRLYREAFRLSRSELPVGLDLVLIPRGSAEPTLIALMKALPTLAHSLAQLKVKRRTHS